VGDIGGSEVEQRREGPACKSVLGNVTLASVSNWADQIRQARQETYNWHFVDIPRSAAAFDDAP